MRRILRPGGIALIGDGWIRTDLYKKAQDALGNVWRKEAEVRYSSPGSEIVEKSLKDAGIRVYRIIRDESGGVWALFRK